MDAYMLLYVASEVTYVFIHSIGSKRFEAPQVVLGSVINKI